MTKTQALKRLAKYHGELEVLHEQQQSAKTRMKELGWYWNCDGLAWLYAREIKVCKLIHNTHQLVQSMEEIEAIDSAA